LPGDSFLSEQPSLSGEPLCCPGYAGMLNMQLLPYLCGFFPCFAFGSAEYWKKKGNNRSCRYSVLNNVIFSFFIYVKRK